MPRAENLPPYVSGMEDADKKGSTELSRKVYSQSVHSPLALYDLPVHANGRESEDRHIHCHWLDEVHQVAHESAKDPAVWVEGVGQREGDTRSTHQHVREGQVSYKKVGDVVHLARATNDIEEQVVAKDAHQSHQGVAGNDEQLERLQKLYTHKLGAAFGGAVLQCHLKDLTGVVPIHLMRHTWGGELSCPATACALHPERLMSTWRG